MAGEFVHLHVHSEHSVLDGMSSISSIVETAQAQRSPAVAITDHGVMSGIVQLFREAAKAGIKAIPGMEAYHVPDRHSRDQVRDGKQNHHLVLLATTDVGYRNLMKISSEGFLNGYYFNPRIDNDFLSRHSSGLIVTTSCLGSEVNQLLLAGDRKGALAAAGELRDIFGPENTFVEIQDHNIPDQHRILEDQVWLAKQLDLPLVATNDSHYTGHHDAGTHEALLCAQTGSLLSDPDRFRFGSDQHWIKTPEEMWELFPEDEFPGACVNTLAIAERVDVTSPLTKEHRIPKFSLPKEWGDPQGYMREMVTIGAQKRYGNEDGVVSEAVKGRIEYELDIINSQGYADYFLIVSDMMKWAHARGIWTGPGRGSAAGSAVSYALDITNVDPLRHGLYFERFLNPDRPSMPDIDIDFERQPRDEVVQYLIDRYGQDQVAKISTYGVYKGKGAIKAAARVTGLSVDTANQLTRLYPPSVLQIEIPLSQLVIASEAECSPDWRHQWRNGAAFRKAANSTPEIRSAVDLAVNLEGILQVVGKHAAGVLITPGPLTDYVPVRMSSDGIISSQYDKRDVEDIGLLKMDLLGLDNLSIIRRAVELIRTDAGRVVDINNLPLDDPEVYRMLAAGDTGGVFQLESPGMTDLIVRLKPTCFEDISAVGALYRPGPMASNAHLEYADRKNGRKPIDSVHPELAKLLKSTYSMPIYQEQVMALAVHFAGYSTAAADSFRKAMGKKDPVVMAAQYDKFRDGVVEKGYGERLAAQLWDIIEPFSGYAFNASHAVSYGLISYYTAWLKVHYPAQYAAACIDYMDRARVATHLNEYRSRGVQVYAPDINRSGIGSTTSGSSVWLGFNGIAYLGGGTAVALISERDRGGPFAGLGDFLVRMKHSTRINKKAIGSLILAGAFDGLHGSRKAMHDNLDGMLDAAASMANASAINTSDEEDDLFGDIDGEVQSAVEVFDLDGPADYDSVDKSQLERSVLGFFVGQHPFTLLQPRVNNAVKDGLIPAEAITAAGLDSSMLESRVLVMGVISSIQNGKSRKGSQYSKFVLESGHEARVDCIVFGKPMREGDSSTLVLVEGILKEDGDDGSEEQVSQAGAYAVVVDKVDFISLARVSERPVLQVVGERTRRSPRSDDDVEDRPAPRRSRKDRGSPQPTYIFYPSSPDELAALSSLLRECGQGTVPVVISYQDEEVRHDDLRFDLTEQRVADIYLECGVQFSAS